MDKHIIADVLSTGQVMAYCSVCDETRIGHKDYIVTWAHAHKGTPCVAPVRTM